MKTVNAIIIVMAYILGTQFIMKFIDVALMDTFHLQPGHPVLFIPFTVIILFCFFMLWRTTRKNPTA